VMQFELVVSLSLAVMFSFSIILDLYGYFIKTTCIESAQTEALALSNWVVYHARVINMVLALILAFSFESGMQLSIPLVFIGSFLMASFAAILFIYTDRVESLLKYTFGIFIFYPFAGMRKKTFWRPLNLSVNIFFLSALVSAGLIYMAIILPFYTVSFFPEFRMSIVYFGQFFTFMSTVILLSYIDPKIMKYLDLKKCKYGPDGFVFGRIWAIFMITLIMLCSFFLWS
jgi:hypothetical protein